MELRQEVGNEVVPLKAGYVQTLFNASHTTVPSVLHIGLLSTFRLTYGDEPVTRVDTPRLRSLLAYLVLHCGLPQIRQHIAFTFWPDSAEKQALTNLRHLLHDLRRALPEADRFIRVDSKTLTWQHNTPFTLDIDDFEHALAQVEEATQRGSQRTVREALEKAVHLYQGDLLPGCYDEWIESERGRLRQVYLRALERLVRLLEDRRDYAAAIHYARRLQQKEPMQEATYGALMRLHALHGDRASALRVYDECVEVLQRELDIAPGPATRRLHERLLSLREPLAQQIAAHPARRAEELPLVGRHEEWGQLKAAWRRAAQEQAHLVVVKGEAGIGKTRLIEELLAWAARQGIATANARSYAAEGRLAYAPVADWLRTEAQSTALPRLSPVWMSEVSRILPELRLDHPDLPELEPVQESWQRLRLFEALSRAVLASGEPLLLVLDDMQWTDAETLAWLRYLLRFAPEARLLVAGTIRTEEMDAEPALAALLSDLGRDGVITEITLGPLTTEEASSVAAHVAGRALDEGQMKRLHEETEGNPLFVVETVRAGLLEEATPDVTLPPKVKAVITSRLAQLSPEAKNLAGLAATIGRAFTVEVLVEAMGRAEERVAEALDELWRRHLIREHGAGAYDFSHDKLREGTYHEISPVRRGLLHRRVARALETVYANDLDAFSGQLAAHYEQGGLAEQALRYYHRAGQLAKDVHANEEAIRLFNKALALLEGFSKTQEHDEQELELQTALGASLVVLKGHGAPEVRQTYERAMTLCEQLGRASEAPILRALANLNLSAGHLRQAHALGEEILQQAQRSQDAVLMVEGGYVVGVSSFWMGWFTQARQHLKQAIRRYDPQQHSIHVALYAQDPKVVCLCRLGRTLWYLGYPEQAERSIENSLRLAQVLGHPHSQAYAMTYAAHFYVDLGDSERAQECVAALLSLAAEQGLSLWEGAGNMLQGALLAEQGNTATGITRLREGITAWVGTGGGSLSVSQYQGYLAAAYQKGGAVEAGLAALSEGFALMEKTGERFYEAELYRLKGELLLAGGVGVDDAASCFEQALDVACRQEARSLELRAAMNLGQLRYRQGHAEQAVHLLQNVYEGFTEGFDTPDLKKASALLDAWSSTAGV